MAADPDDPVGDELDDLFGQSEIRQRLEESQRRSEREPSAHEVSAVACPRGARLSGAAVPHRALRLSWEPAALYDVMAAARQATARPPSSAEQAA